MKTKTISGVPYYTYPNGVMVPASFVRESLPVKIRTPKDAMALLQDIAFAEVEHVVVFTLDGNNQIIKRHDITKGLANQSQIHPRETFRPAFIDGAVSILVAHNHPSGNLEPSESDLIATRRLVECSKTLGIPVLDHMIVSGYTGTADIGESARYRSIRECYPNYFG